MSLVHYYTPHLQITSLQERNVFTFRRVMESVKLKAATSLGTHMALLIIGEQFQYART